jgi:hypothetical protein
MADGDVLGDLARAILIPEAGELFQLGIGLGPECVGCVDAGRFGPGLVLEPCLDCSQGSNHRPGLRSPRPMVCPRPGGCGVHFDQRRADTKACPVCGYTRTRPDNGGL